MVHIIQTVEGFQMWVVFTLIMGALGFYLREQASMELTSIGIVYFVLLVFHVFPVIDRNGVARITTTRILHGFSNPVLIAVLALWAIGQGIVRTGRFGPRGNASADCNTGP